MMVPFWYRLTQVVLEKRSLNGCCSSSVINIVILCAVLCFIRLYHMQTCRAVCRTPLLQCGLSSELFNHFLWCRFDLLIVDCIT